MARKILAICGVILILGGVGLHFHIRSASSDARALDNFEAPTSRGKCSTPLEGVNISKRTISIKDTLGLTAILRNSEKNEDCEVAININAPNFKISPNEPDRIIDLPLREEATTSWILSPRGLGTFEVAVSAELSSQIIGIKVSNNPMDLVPAWVPLITYLFGPMLTVPWWYEQCQKRKNQK